MRTLGIICAMQSELDPILSDLQIKETKEKAGMKFFNGVINDVKIVAVKSGIGKVNAAICTQILVNDFNVDDVINSGVAGGTQMDIFPMDIVIGNDLVQHDVDASAFGDPIGQVPNLDTFSFKCDEKLVNLALEASKEIKESINVHVGRIVSGDQFIATKEKMQWLIENFDSKACEMEGAAIAQTCYLNKIPFIVLRSISDNALNGSHMDYLKFNLEATKNSYKLLNKFIELYKKL